ncbi:DMT family transporter [Profundibacterium mesophilum]|nr:DMT family transporter [Profundibacterium mesophilum]
MLALSDNTRGAILMAGSMTAFTINDACMKALSSSVPLFEAVFLRGSGVTVMLLFLAWASGGLRHRPSARDGWLILLRTCAEIAAAGFFLTALFNMPIANVTAILQAIPLTVSLAGALFLGEALGWRRLTAITVGFAGVLLIVRPGGEGFTGHSLLALASVLCVTVRDLAARRMSRGLPSLSVALAAAVGVTIAAGIGSLFQGWVPLPPVAALQLAGATGFVLAGYVFSVSAMRIGELGVVAQFRYVSLLVALILGLAVFGDWPSGLTLAGAAVIVGTGLFTLSRERKLRRVHPSPVPLRLR